MKRKFLTNLVLLVSLNILIKPFWIFGIDRTVQNVVGSQEFGFYYALLNFSFLFNILLDLGITNFNTRNIAQHSALLNKHFSGILTLKLLLSIAYFVATFGIALLIGYRGHQLGLLALVGFNQFLISFIMYLRSNISGMLMFKTEGLMSVLDRILMILIMSVLLWGNVSKSPFKIDWFVYAQTISYTLVALVGFIIVRFKSRFRRLSWNPIFFLMILKKSAPFAILVLLMTLYHRIDSVLLERLAPADADLQVGIYAHAFRIMDAANQFAYLFSLLLFPIFSKMIKEKQPLNEMIKMPLMLLFTATFILTMGFWWYSKEIMELLYVDHINESASVLSVMIFGTIAVAGSYVFATLLTANGNLKILIGIAAFSMLLSFTLNVLLIPRYLALGSAIANVSALFSSLFLHQFFAFKKLKIHFPFHFYIRILLFVIFVVGFLIVCAKLLVDWRISIFVFGVGSLIFAFVFGILNLKEISTTLIDTESVDSFANNE
ncbi:MAG: oligosaccharide flippase family protein [Bacteroidales bacterium]|nr:oligosaccharide flippase family protein [Bacteroidales bacterium]